MEAMTSEREAFEKWARGEGYALAKQDDNSYHGIGIRNAWEGWKARAHLAQPAQAVDVGAIREVIEGLRNNAKDCERANFPILGQHLGTCADKLTRALSGEKAGPVGAGWQPIETAPKDGSAVLVAFTADGERQVAEAYWSDDDDVWVCSRDGFMLYSRNEPTHFQPMPPLPASPTPDKEG